ncbi:hypothetical protein Pcinc_017448 [Petrolisthes cinctipes]|uniref:Carbohydrate sulfotransferase n=1 Tax=Petrolisthes cinctipes TaxID=88211 RepID=A0AAE1FQQ7_PETCI|nr:hypothetical protein Pcinc_017448 [Petrolisthes cinctipes]
MNLICGSRVKGVLMTASIMCLVTLLTLQTNRVSKLSGLLAGSVLMQPQSFSSWKGHVEELTSSSSSSSSADLVGNTITTTNTTSGEYYFDGTDPLKSEDYNNNNNNNVTASPTTANMATNPKKQKKKKARKWALIQYQKDQIQSVEWTEAMSEKVREELTKREAGVEEGCKSQEVQNAPKLKINQVVKKLIHVKDRQMMWCPVFKAASTTWSKNLLRLAGKKNTGAFQHTARRLYPPPDNMKELHRLSNDTTWLLIVRHPLQRLLSAYRDKMLRQRAEKDSFVQLQRRVAATYQDPNNQTITTTTTTTTTNNNNNTSNANNTSHHVPTFTQFLMKVRDDVQKAWQGKKIHVNQHWSPYWLVCAPCQLHYHLIAQVETFTRDQEYLIHLFHMEDQAVNVHSHASNFDSYEGTDKATQHYFSQVPKELLNQIIQLYLPDFILFGYSPDEYLKLLPSVQSSTNVH